MKTIVDEGNPAIVKIGCTQCPSNLMLNPTEAELAEIRNLVGKRFKCQNCGTVWYLSGLEVREFVTQEGSSFYAIPYWIPTMTKGTPISLQSMLQDTFEETEESAGEDESGAKIQESPTVAKQIHKRRARTKKWSYG
jgi:hypothetical protein